MTHILACPFILLQDSVMKSRLFSFPFFTVSRILLTPVRLAFIDTSPSPWHRLTTNPPLDCPSPQHLWGVQEMSQGKGSSLMFRNSLCKSLVVHPCQRSLTLIQNLKVIRMGRNQCEVYLTVSMIPRRKGPMGISFLMYHSLYHLHLLHTLVPFLLSYVSGDALLPIVLCLVWWRVTIFSLGVTLCYSIISGSST